MCTINGMIFRAPPCITVRTKLVSAAKACYSHGIKTQMGLNTTRNRRPSNSDPC